MKTLVEHFQKRENGLKSQLREANTLNQIVERIQNEISRLRDFNGEYIGNLIPSQANVALQGLAELNETLNLLTRVELQDSQYSIIVPNTQFSEQSASESSSQDIMTVGAISGVGGIVGSLVGGWLSQRESTSLSQDFLNSIDNIICKSQTQLPASLPQEFRSNINSICVQGTKLPGGGMEIVMGGLAGFLLGVVIAGVLAVIFLSQRQRKQPQEKPTTQFPPTKRTDLQKVVDIILSYFQERLKVIDTQVAKEGNKTQSKPPKPKLEDHQDLLEFLQNLIGAARNEQAQTSRIKELLEQLPQFLKFHKIEVIFYQENIKDKSMFDFVPSLDAKLKEYVTLVPALVKENQVIIRGRVVKPAS